MSANDPPTTEPSAEATKAQAEFARFKNQVEHPGAAATGPGASFASPLPSSAIPAWSLRPGPVGPRAPGPGAGSWGSGAPGGGGGYGSIVSGVGTTIRLGVEVLNAALSSSVQMINGYAVGWGSGSCDCEECNPCGGYDCCSVMGGGCRCCEPSVGSCC